MLNKLILSLVVFLVVGLGLTFLLGPLLDALAVPFLTIFGNFFETWGWVLGAAAGVWYFGSGRFW